MNTVFEQKNKEGQLLRKVYIDSFFGNYSQASGVELLGNIALLSDRIPRDIIPIGEDGIGNYLCLGIQKNNYGKIFMWWADGQPKIDETPTHKNVDQIADSFTQIAKNLISE
jgi:hypothetical protein